MQFICIYKKRHYLGNDFVTGGSISGPNTPRNSCKTMKSFTSFLFLCCELCLLIDYIKV